MKKKGISAIIATVLIIFIAAVTIIWAAIIPMLNNLLNQESFTISQNGTEVYNITYKTVDSIEMIESGRYPSYIMCYAESVSLGMSYNSTDIANQYNSQCVEYYGVDKVILNDDFNKELTKEWLVENCLGAICDTFEENCEYVWNINSTKYKCGDYKVEMKGGN